MIEKSRQEPENTEESYQKTENTEKSRQEAEDQSEEVGQKADIADKNSVDNSTVGIQQPLAALGTVQGT